MNDDNDYSVVSMDVSDNTIFITDTKDGESVAINPDNWELIKETIDQQIADGYLNSQIKTKRVTNGNDNSRI